MIRFCRCFWLQFTSLTMAPASDNTWYPVFVSRKSGYRATAAVGSGYPEQLAPAFTGIWGSGAGLWRALFLGLVKLRADGVDKKCFPP